MDTLHPISDLSSKQSKLLTGVKYCIRYKCYSLGKEQAFVNLISWCIRFHGQAHYQDMDEAEVKALGEPFHFLISVMSYADPWLSPGYIALASSNPCGRRVGRLVRSSTFVQRNG
jgi:hypothetical protein